MDPFSEYQKEDEVILPPGNIFSFQGVGSDKDGYMIIKLKLISDVGALSHEGLIMQVAMQSKIMTETEAKIMCMGGNDRVEAMLDFSDYDVPPISKIFPALKNPDDQIQSYQTDFWWLYMGSQQPTHEGPRASDKLSKKSQGHLP